MKTRTLNPRRILDARLRAGMVQEDVSHALRRRGFKTAAKSVSLWERGVNTPRADLVPALAEVLGVSIDELFSDDEEEESLNVSVAFARMFESAIEALVDRRLQEVRS